VPTEGLHTQAPQPILWCCQLLYRPIGTTTRAFSNRCPTAITPAATHAVRRRRTSALGIAICGQRPAKHKRNHRRPRVSAESRRTTRQSRQDDGSNRRVARCFSAYQAVPAPSPRTAPSAVPIASPLWGSRSDVVDHRSRPHQEPPDSYFDLIGRAPTRGRGVVQRRRRRPPQALIARAVLCSTASGDHYPAMTRRTDLLGRVRPAARSKREGDGHHGYRVSMCRRWCSRSSRRSCCHRPSGKMLAPSSRRRRCNRMSPSPPSPCPDRPRLGHRARSPRPHNLIVVLRHCVRQTGAALPRAGEVRGGR